MVLNMSQFDFVFPVNHNGKYAQDGIRMNDLIKNIDKLHTTEMGVERIKRNCQIETDDVVQWSGVQILDKNAKIERIGKNWYIFTGHYKITVNAYSYTIITAHRVEA